MDTVTAAAARTATPAAPASDSAPDDAARALTADFTTFLTLLTTQMRNQDPLQPLESTEFVAQLAQFSAVEQQIAGNKTLGGILEALGGSSVGAMAGWLGRDVRSGGGIDFLSGSVETFPPAGPTAAKSATLLVMGPKGDVVREIAFEPGADSVSWDGKLADGAAAPAGAYQFRARFATADGETETLAAETWSRVTEVRRAAADGVELVLAGGGLVDASTVSALRPAA